MSIRLIIGDIINCEQHLRRSPPNQSPSWRSQQRYGCFVTVLIKACDPFVPSLGPTGHAKAFTFPETDRRIREKLFGCGPPHGGPSVGSCHVGFFSFFLFLGQNTIVDLYVFNRVSLSILREGICGAHWGGPVQTIILHVGLSLWVFVVPKSDFFFFFKRSGLKLKKILWKLIKNN